MAAATYDITIEENADFELQVVWTDNLGVAINLTGYTAAAHIHRDDGDLSTNIALTATITNAATGTLKVSLPAANTANLNLPDGNWGLFVTAPGGKVTKLLKGTVTYARD